MGSPERKKTITKKEDRPKNNGSLSGEMAAIAKAFGLIEEFELIKNLEKAEGWNKKMIEEVQRGLPEGITLGDLLSYYHSSNGPEGVGRKRQK